MSSPSSFYRTDLDARKLDRFSVWSRVRQSRWTLKWDTLLIWLYFIYILTEVFLFIYMVTVNISDMMIKCWVHICVGGLKTLLLKHFLQSVPSKKLHLNFISTNYLHCKTIAHGRLLLELCDFCMFGTVEWWTSVYIVDLPDSTLLTPLFCSLVYV